MSEMLGINTRRSQHLLIPSSVPPLFWRWRMRHGRWRE